jgi:hypothetical protein
LQVALHDGHDNAACHLHTGLLLLHIAFCTCTAALMMWLLLCI